MSDPHDAMAPTAEEITEMREDIEKETKNLRALLMEQTDMIADGSIVTDKAKTRALAKKMDKHIRSMINLRVALHRYARVPMGTLEDFLEQKFDEGDQI